MLRVSDTLVNRDVETKPDTLAEAVPQLRAPAGIGRSEVGTIVTRADARIGRKRGVVFSWAYTILLNVNNIRPAITKYFFIYYI